MLPVCGTVCWGSHYYMHREIYCSVKYMSILYEKDVNLCDYLGFDDNTLKFMESHLSEIHSDT